MEVASRLSNQVQILNYINGELSPPISGKLLDCYEPATGEKIGTCPNSGLEDVNAAVKAATSAFEGWSNLTAADRAAYLNAIADGIAVRQDEFAKAETLDTGKPLWLTRSVDIPRAIQNFRFFAAAASQFSSESHFTEGVGINYTLRRPLGVVACISPWNLPLYLFSWKIAPALCVGNCVVGKPSEITPNTAFMLAEVCIEIGLPAGVLNIIHGVGNKSGDHLITHSEIKAISFTGSTAVGRHIASQAAKSLQKTSLELGGKNPVIIFADCDFEGMLKATLASSFANQGQICLCGSRIYVERGLYADFKAEFVKRTAAMTVGDPLDPNSKLGALTSQPHLEKVLSYIRLAKEEGGDILCGGGSVTVEGRCRNGWFVQPTIVEGLPVDCRTNQEEIFGPVVTIAQFDSEADALQLANSTDYGLAAVIWTENIKRALSMAEYIQAGIVWINGWMPRDLRTPFGGVRQSGVGREGGNEAMRFFTEPKNVFVQYK